MGGELNLNNYLSMSHQMVTVLDSFFLKDIFYYAIIEQLLENKIVVEYPLSEMLGTRSILDFFTILNICIYL